jgi:outer membrane murein-binding lipoprotein Lpp
VIRSSLVVIALAALLLAGCGSSSKTVSKAEYQSELQRVGKDLTDTGSELGRSIDIATFNGNVDKLRDHLHKAADDLHGLKPPADAKDANNRLAGALDDFAGELEPVKEARRRSIVQARAALLRVSNSAPVRQARTATRELKAKGYDVGDFGSL